MLVDNIQRGGDGKAGQGGLGDRVHGGYGQGDRPQQGVGDDCVDGGQHSSRTSRPRKDFTLVKKKGIVPDGLVQGRLDSFLVAFHNLQGGNILLGQTGGGGGR